MVRSASVTPNFAAVIVTVAFSGTEGVAYVIALVEAFAVRKPVLGAVVAASAQGNRQVL